MKLLTRITKAISGSPSYVSQRIINYAIPYDHLALGHTRVRIWKIKIWEQIGKIVETREKIILRLAIVQIQRVASRTLLKNHLSQVIEGGGEQTILNGTLETRKWKNISCLFECHLGH